MQYYFQQQAIGKSKRDRTRALLLDGLVAVAARHGVDGTTVQAVTRESGLAHGTFYNHFHDRDELIITTATAIADEINARIASAVQDLNPGLTRLVTAVDILISEAVANPDHGNLLASTIGRYRAVTDRVRPDMCGDLTAAGTAGQISIRPSVLLDEQVCALIGLAIKLRLSGGAWPAVNRNTAEAILRLLGMTPAAASALVADDIGGAAA